MERKIIKLAIVIIFLFAAATTASSQQKTPEPTIDQQIAAAREENNKLKLLNNILVENAKIRLANKQMQKGSPQKPDVTGSQDNNAANDTAIVDKSSGGQDTKTETKAAADSEVKAGGQTLPTDKGDLPPNRFDGKKQSNPPTKNDPPQDSGKTATPTDTKTENINQPKQNVAGSGVPAGSGTQAGSGGSPVLDKCKTLVKNQKQRATNDLNLCQLAYIIASAPSRVIDTGNSPDFLTKAFFGRLEETKVVENPIEKALIRAETDGAKLSGSDAMNTGTTNLVTSPRIPSIFNLAVENGLATQQTDGTTVNLRFNPVGVIEMLNKGTTGNFNPFSNSDPLVKQLRRTAFGLSYDTARGVKIPQFTGSREQFSGMSFSYGFYNDRAPDSDFVEERAFEFLVKYTTTYHERSLNIFKELYATTKNADGSETVISKFITSTNKALEGKADLNDNSKTEDQRAQAAYDVLREQFRDAPVDDLKKSETIITALTAFNVNLMAYNTAMSEFNRKLNRKNLLTFDYNYNRSFSVNDVSNFKLAYEKGWESGMDLRFNGGFSMFHAPIFRTPVTTVTAVPGKQSRIRDFGFSTQFDLPLRGLSETLRGSVLSLGFKWQRLLTDKITLFDGTEVGNLKGNIFIGQAKVRVPIVAGLWLPLSFTYSNRPELLIGEKQTRGNIGFTFDVTNLLNRWNPFTSLINASNP